MVDFENKPIANATIDSRGGGHGEFQTNEKGELENGFQIRNLHAFVPVFSIQKAGFYSFYDYFGVFDFLAYGQDNRDKPVTIELLKIPQNSAEKKAIGNQQSKREFFEAARKGDASAVRKFLNSGLRPNLKTSDLRGVPVPIELPIIHYAAQSGDSETIKEFLKAGVNLRKKDDPTQQILITYLRANPFLRKYPETETERKNLINNFEDGAINLIEAGADLTATYYFNSVENTLTLAARQGYEKVVRAIAVKVFPNKRKILSVGLIYSIGNVKTDTIDLLLKNGANPNFLEGTTDGSYGLECFSALMSAVKKANADAVKLLIADKADPNLACPGGKSALRVALDENNFDIFDLLIKSGADVNAVDRDGQTNLIYAAGKGNLAAVKKLLELGVPVNARNKNGATALMFAVNNGSWNSRLQIVKLLLESGADPNIASQPKFYYSGKEIQQCETALIDAAANADIDTDQNTPLKIIDLLVSHKADVNFSCENGDSAIKRAVNGQVKGFKKLLEAGADITGEKGKALLDYAGSILKKDYNKRQMEEIIKMLEEAGAR